MMNTTAKSPPKQRLAAERIRRRWTQLEVADQLGTTPGNVSRWERGVTTPSPYFRSKLCELFGMSAHALGLTWDASAELLAQVQTSTTGALTQIQAHPERGCKGSAQAAIESIPRYRDGSAMVLWIKTHIREVGDERRAMLADGLNRPEHRPERLLQTVTHRLHSNPDWVLVLDTVAEVRLVVDVRPSDRQSALTTIICPQEA